MAIFPNELTDAFLYELEDDPEVLKSCSLVCRAWIPVTRSYLFSKISIDYHFPTICKALTRILDSNSCTFKTNIKHIHVKFAAGEEDAGNQALSLLASFSTPVSMEFTGMAWSTRLFPFSFPSITSLVIWSVDPFVFINVLSSLPSLKLLDIGVFSRDLPPYFRPSPLICLTKLCVLHPKTYSLSWVVREPASIQDLELRFNRTDAFSSKIYSILSFIDFFYLTDFLGQGSGLELFRNLQELYLKIIFKSDINLPELLSGIPNHLRHLTSPYLKRIVIDIPLGPPSSFSWKGHLANSLKLPSLLNLQTLDIVVNGSHSLMAEILGAEIAGLPSLHYTISATPD